MEKFSTFDGKLFKEVDTCGTVLAAVHTFQTFTVLIRQPAKNHKSIWKTSLCLENVVTENSAGIAQKGALKRNFLYWLLKEGVRISQASLCNHVGGSQSPGWSLREGLSPPSSREALPGCTSLGPFAGELLTEDEGGCRNTRGFGLQLSLSCPARARSMELWRKRQKA